MENIIIIGGGPAGISAALYAARSGRDPLVIEHGAGGLKKAEKLKIITEAEPCRARSSTIEALIKPRLLASASSRPRSWAWKASIPSRFTPTRAILTQRQ
ncbi:MAG: FAD-dependent oxidoreductase [Lachnospiraceae bacterium]